MNAIIEANDIGLILGAVGSLLTVIGAFALGVVRMARSLSQINRAVNHQGPDEPPLVEIVKGLRDMMAVHDERATDTRNKVAALELLATSRHRETSEALVGLSHGQDEIRKGLSRLQGRVSKVETAKKAGAR